MQNITYKEATKMFQLNPKNITVPHTLINFHSMIIGSKLSKDYSHNDLIEGKNVIIRNWIEEQLQLQGHWDLKIPFEDECKRCNGSGEIYKLEKEKFEKDCAICRGVGHLWLVCRTCKGTGRYKDEDIQDLIINVACNCSKFADEFGQEYKGKIRVTCRECRGKGSRANLKNDKDWQHKDFRYTGKIYSTTKCPNCDGYGFRFPLTKVCNPVLSSNLAQVISNTETAHEDPFIPNPVHVIHKIPVRTVYSKIEGSLLKLARESV